MLMKEYRICMPLTVDEYRIGQLYMISKHSCEQSGGGEGVEVVRNEPDNHPKYGLGQVTEKRIYLSSKLPSWARAFVPRFFYVVEKAWNFYPFTITEYSVSLIPKFSIRIETRFENNNGSNDNVFGDEPTPAANVSYLDILNDPIPEKHYKESEDLSRWKSSKTGRGPLEKDWRKNHMPIMCSYKRVQCSFEVYGFQTRTEEFLHRVIQDILLVGHREAVAWMDEWLGLTLEEVREYEHTMQEKTNSKVKSSQNNSARGSEARLCSYNESLGGGDLMTHWERCFNNHCRVNGASTSSRPVFSRSISVTDERSLKKMGVTTSAMEDPSVPSSPMRLNSTPE